MNFVVLLFIDVYSCRSLHLQMSIISSNNKIIFYISTSSCREYSRIYRYSLTTCFLIYYNLISSLYKSSLILNRLSLLIPSVLNFDSPFQPFSSRVCRSSSSRLISFATKMCVSWLLVILWMGSNRCVPCKHRVNKEVTVML